MALKKYETNRPASITVTVYPKGAQPTLVRFAKAGNMAYGSYLTDDAQIQEAIEKHPWYGREFKMVYEAKEQPTEFVVKVESVQSQAPTAIEEPSVTSIAKARMWLQATHEATFEATTKEGIQQEALQKYNVEFPNWL